MATSQRTARLLAAFAVGALIYALPLPVGLNADAWQLFAIFIGTIFLVMAGVFPMGAASLMGLTVAIATNALSFEVAFSGFTSPITWLILSAFFISFGIVHTGLGRRIGLMFIATFGKSALGIAYGVALTELILAPGTPSSTARTGGILFPIVDSIARSFDSLPNHPSRKKIGSYLVLCLFNFTVITSAMFLTAMAANPFAAKLAKNFSIEITWTSWALHALAPGLASLIVIPIVLLKIAGPEIRDTRAAVVTAKAELKALGPMKRAERLMAFGFVMLMVMWLLGPIIKISAVTAALLGLAFLLVANVVTWDQLLKLHSAFETFFWFGALLALAEGLSSTGFTSWFGEVIAGRLASMPFLVGISSLFLVYFYTHYFFASCVAHVGSMFMPFLSAAIVLGAPGEVFALALCFGSSLFGSLTHYGIGPAPILFGAGYNTLQEWWRFGFITSVVNIILWVAVGSVWWRILGSLT